MITGLASWRFAVLDGSLADVLGVVVLVEEVEDCVVEVEATGPAADARSNGWSLTLRMADEEAVRTAALRLDCTQLLAWGDSGLMVDGQVHGVDLVIWSQPPPSGLENRRPPSWAMQDATTGGAA